MAAVRLWVQADLRRRWLSWAVLGVLAGLVVGLAAAGAVGARQSSGVVDAYDARLSGFDAGVLPNDPAFDVAKQRAVADLPEVTRAAPFAIMFVNAAGNDDFWPGLVPTTKQSARLMRDVLVDGRYAADKAPHEAVVDENARDQLGFGIGSRFALTGTSDDGKRIRTYLKVVGITKSVTPTGYGWMPSPAFYEYGTNLGIPSFTNMFVGLRQGEAGIEQLEGDVARIAGRPVNIMNTADEQRAIHNSTDLESQGLWLFALAVLLGGGTLVAQALARSVTTGARDLPAWSAMGADRPTLVAGLALPGLVTALVAPVVAVFVAVVLSPRFPIGVSRRYDLHLGVNADWTVLLLGALIAFLAIAGGSTLVAIWRVRSGEARAVRPSTVGRLATLSGAPPAVAIGTRLALEPGRGRRAVPVRSALIGAIVGVLGVVACFTFRAGIDDATTRPERSGIVWDSYLAPEDGPLPAKPVAALLADSAVSSAVRARWVRSVTFGGRSIPTWATAPAKGDMQWVVLSGRAPRGPDEVALGPATMSELGLKVGDHTVGVHRTRLTVVGEVLLPESPHTGYTDGAWIPRSALATLQPNRDRRVDGYDMLLVRWRPGADVKGASAALAKQGAPPSPAELPLQVQALRQTYSLPLVLGVFLALLAVATLAHALVTTVRRRRHELAVLRALGFTRRQSRLAIAWQATLLIVIGLVVGVPLGVVFGRLVWRSLAVSFPLVYTPPFALLATVLVVPVALLVANLLAAWPSRRASRIQPAAVLRSE